MTIITSHILNGTDGSHAEGIVVSCAKLGETKIFETKTDDCGRLKKKIDSEKIDTYSIYELVFETGNYWKERGFKQIMDQVILRFKINDPLSNYHMPIIINIFVIILNL